MRWPTLFLVALIALLQYPLWFGKGGLLRVHETERQLEAERETIRSLEVRNAGLEAEVRDLRTGLDAVEERARFDLGMVRKDEVFYQILDRRSAAAQGGER